MGYAVWVHLSLLLGCDYPVTRDVVVQEDPGSQWLLDRWLLAEWIMDLKVVYPNISVYSEIKVLQGLWTWLLCSHDRTGLYRTFQEAGEIYEKEPERISRVSVNKYSLFWFFTGARGGVLILPWLIFSLMHSLINNKLIWNGVIAHNHHISCLLHFT